MSSEEDFDLNNPNNSDALDADVDLVFPLSTSQLSNVELRKVHFFSHDMMT